MMFELFSIAFCGFTLLWCLYWAVLRPHIHLSTEFEVRKLHLELREHILERSEGYDSEAVKDLQNTLNFRAHRHITFSMLALYMSKRSSIFDEKLNRTNDIYQDAPSWISDMRAKRDYFLLRSIVANSPAWLPVFFFVGFFAEISSAYKAKVERARALAPYVGTEESTSYSDGCPQGA